MIGNLNHIAIVVPDLTAAVHQYQNIFGVFVSSPQKLPNHGIQLSVVKLSNTTIELITPFGENSPIQNFLDRNPDGGVHHLCYEVPNIEKAKDQLMACGLRVIGDGIAQPGYHGNPILFFYPKECLGVLIALEEKSVSNTRARVDIERIGPHHTFSQKSSSTFRGVEGIGVGIEVDFKRPTPQRSEEKE